MKKLTSLKVLVFLLLAAIVIPSCMKTQDQNAKYTPENEAALIQSWLNQMVTNKKDIDTTTTGLFYIVQTVGTGATVHAGDSVTVKYTGMFLDGSVFDDSSYHGNGTFKYLHKAPSDPTKTLIQGWEEGIEVLNKGGIAAFLIPSAKGYGVNGSYPSIPPYTPLIFVISVVDIKTNSL
jgi:FKBP-type peptidyl-prolyl cis-trans isomerase